MALNPKRYALNAKNGFTLIEGIVYLGLFILIFAVLINATLSLFTAFGKAAAQRETIASARLAMDAIAGEIKYAKEIYQPTSCFGISDPKAACAGGKRQVSLLASRDLPADESRTYVDIYLDGGRVYLKREGSAASALTSDKVRAANLVFERLSAGGANGKESVRTTLTVEYDTDSPKIQNSVTLYSSAALRGAY